MEFEKRKWGCEAEGDYKPPEGACPLLDGASLLLGKIADPRQLKCLSL
jgi:hypothetical protein